MKNLDNLLLYRLRYPISYLILILSGAGLLFAELGNTPSGLHSLEIAQLLRAGSLQDIITTPVNFIFSIFSYVSLNLLGPSELAARLPSAAVGSLALAAFYWALRTLYWRRIAVFGSLMLLSSSWFLHTARFGTGSIMAVLMVTLFIAVGTKVLQSSSKRWLFALAAICFIGLFVPLFAYLFIAAFIANTSALKRSAGLIRSKLTIIGAASAITVALGFIVYGQIESTEPVLRQLLGVPLSFPSVTEYLKNVQETFGFIFWRSFEFPGSHLGDLPMLDIFTATMTALGLYKFERSWHSERSRFMLIALFILLLITSLNPSDANYVIMMPFIYIIASNGVSTLLGQWYSIFPRNPIARTVGLLPVALIISIVFGYHTQRYFVAWNNAPETRGVFSQTVPAVQNYIDSSDASNSAPVTLITTNESVQSAALLAREGVVSANGLPPDIISARQRGDLLIIESSIELTPQQQAVLGDTKQQIVVERQSDPVLFFVYEP